jgi:recombinase
MKQNEPAGGGGDGAVTGAGLRDGIIARAVILPVDSYGTFEHETFLDLRVFVLRVGAGQPNSEGLSSATRMVRALRGLGNAHAIVGAKAKADARMARIVPVIETIRGEGATSLRGIAEELNRQGILTARGGQWYATTVKNLLDRAAR